MKDPTITFGPYMVRYSEPQRIDQHIQNTGCFIEFVTAKDKTRLLIFCYSEYVGEKAYFANYVIREKDLPFEITTWGFQVKHHGGIQYITLSAYIAGMYKCLNNLRPIQDFLSDFRELLTVENHWGCLASAQCPLKPHITSAGYCVECVTAYGRHVTVNIAWLFPQDRSTEESTSYLDVISIDFRPKPDRTLGPGKWREAREHFAENLLFQNLRNLAKNSPVSLFEEQAKPRMLAEFDWTPLALMTNQQARQARIQFIQQHPQLIGDLKAMAAALKQSGLYSPNSTPHQICKFLPSLISEATNGSLPRSTL